MRLFVVLRIAAVALLAWTRLSSLGPSEEQLDDLEEAIATALNPNSRLRSVVDAVLLPGMDRNSCEWGLSTEPNDPKSWVGCWDYVRGDLRRVGNRVHARLESEGFRVSRARTDRTIEFTAARKSETVCVDVLAPGFTDGRNTSPSEINPDPGEVFVDVWMSERRSRAQNPCAELAPWDTQGT